MNGFCLKNALISTLLVSNVAWAGSQENSESRIDNTNLIQRTPTIDGQFPISLSAYSRNFYTREGAQAWSSSQKNTESRKSRTVNSAVSVPTKFEWTPEMNAVLESCVERDPRARRKMIWELFDDSQKLHFDNAEDGVKFQDLIKHYKQKIKEKNPEKYGDQLQSKRRHGRQKGAHQFDWTPLLFKIEENLDKTIHEVIPIVWPLLNDSQQMFFYNEPKSQKFYDSLRNQINRFCKQKNIQPTRSNRYSKKSEVLNPEIQPQQMVSPIANGQVPEYIILQPVPDDSHEEAAVLTLPQQVASPIENDQLPDDFPLPLPSVDIDSAKENQAETFVIDDKAMDMLNPMIAALYSSGEFPKEDIDSPKLSLRVPQMEDSLIKKSGSGSKFNWEPLEHLVVNTLKMELPEAGKEIWVKLDDNQRAHFDNMPDGKKKFSRSLRNVRYKIRKDRNQVVVTFDWESCQHLVESTLKMPPKEACEIVWSNLDPNQKNHFNNNYAQKSPFYKGLLKQRRKLQENKNNPPDENMASPVLEMLPQQMMPSIEDDPMLYEFTLPQIDAFSAPDGRWDSF